MITINLLPQEFRVREKRQINVPWLPAVIGVGGLFLLLTAFFYIDFWLSTAKLAKINSEWAIIQPQSARLQQLEQEVTGKLKPENVFLNSFVTADKPLTFMLSWASELFPASMWLVEFKMERIGEGGKVFVKGLTLPSKEKSSIEFIEEYLHELKKKMPDADLSLTTSRQKIKDVELTQFIATFEWALKTEVKKP